MNNTKKVCGYWCLTYATGTYLKKQLSHSAGEMYGAGSHDFSRSTFNCAESLSIKIT